VSPTNKKLSSYPYLSSTNRYQIHVPELSSLRLTSFPSSSARRPGVAALSTPFRCTRVCFTDAAPPRPTALSYRQRTSPRRCLPFPTNGGHLGPMRGIVGHRGPATRRHDSLPGQRSQHRAGRGPCRERPHGPGPSASRTACSEMSSSATAAAPSPSTPPLSSRSCSTPWSLPNASKRCVPSHRQPRVQYLNLNQSVPNASVDLSSHFRVVGNSEGMITSGA
jgi:hypothetical protein